MQYGLAGIAGLTSGRDAFPLVRGQHGFNLGWTFARSALRYPPYFCEHGTKAEKRRKASVHAVVTTFSSQSHRFARHTLRVPFPTC